MLDKTQASVTQNTIINATNLAVAIASKVLGNTIPDKLHGESVTRNTINKLVLADIRQAHMTKGVNNAV